MKQIKLKTVDRLTAPLESLPEFDFSPHCYSVVKVIETSTCHLVFTSFDEEDAPGYVFKVWLTEHEHIERLDDPEVRRGYLQGEKDKLIGPQDIYGGMAPKIRTTHSSLV